MPSLFEPVLPPPPPASSPDQTGSKPAPIQITQLPRAGVRAHNGESSIPLPYPQYRAERGQRRPPAQRHPPVQPLAYSLRSIPALSPTDRMAETPYQDGPLRFFDPYKASLLKGDSPIIGQDIFFSAHVRGPVHSPSSAAPRRRVGVSVSHRSGREHRFLRPWRFLHDLSNNLSVHPGTV